MTASNEETMTNKNLETITLGNGCFWCTEAIFSELKGVHSAESGYSGGHVKNPNCGEGDKNDASFDVEAVRQLLESLVVGSSNNPTTFASKTTPSSTTSLPPSVAISPQLSVVC